VSIIIVLVNAVEEELVIETSCGVKIFTYITIMFNGS